jgi:GNAT superfamily N-acetyltransferase
MPDAPAISLTLHPPLPRDPAAGWFQQELRLSEAGRTIGSLLWFMPPGRDGVMQVLHLHVEDSHRRRGHGSRLVAAAIQQARDLAARREIRLRRAWLVVEQKTQIHARAFMTKNGFHHASTIPAMLQRQDHMVYTRAMD